MDWATKDASDAWLGRCEKTAAKIVVENLDDFGPHDLVLDYACGNGRNAIPVLQRGAHVTLADINPYLLKKAAKAASKISTRFELAHADSVFPHKYDKILLIGLLHIIPDKKETLLRCHDSLKPGGVLYSSSLGDSLHCKSPYRFASASDFVDAHVACGFCPTHITIRWERTRMLYDGIFKKI